MKTIDVPVTVGYGNNGRPTLIYMIEGDLSPVILSGPDEELLEPFLDEAKEAARTAFGDDGFNLDIKNGGNSLTQLSEDAYKRLIGD